MAPIGETTSQPSPELNSTDTPTDSNVTKQPNGMSSTEVSHENANSTENTSIVPPATTENLTKSPFSPIAMIVTITAALQL
ncbi:hypothetical protein Q1695_001324 [Nippostrongylus brasiliensis]|nr:hypothetical protein Q1695_001324 [Nippostrongylus brasiliensis]